MKKKGKKISATKFRGKKELAYTYAYMKIAGDVNRQQSTPASYQDYKKNISTTRRTVRTTREKYIDYFVFNIVDYIYINCGFSRSGARHRALV
jgi:hypothetical protein